MKNQKTTQTQTTETQTPETRKDFADVLKNFAALYTETKTAPSVNPYTKGTPERVAWNRTQNDRKDKYDTALFELSKMVTLAVLKKVIDPTRHSKTDPTDPAPAPSPDGVIRYAPGESDTAVNSGFSPALVSVRRELFSALDTLKKEKNPLTVFDDSYLTPAKGENLGDGLDLVNVASIAILSELDKQTERDPAAPVDFERPYTVHELKTKVYIKDPESLAWTDRETTPIQEIYRAVRRAINDSKAAQTDPRNPYGYLEEETETPDGETVRVYRRLPRYSDIGGHATDGDPDAPVLDGCPAASLTRSPDSTGDAQTVKDCDSLLEELNLTQTQRTVIDKRLQGYGDKAIATALGRSKQAVAKTKTQIQTKWKLTGRRYPTETPDGVIWERRSKDGETVPLVYLSVLENSGDWIDAPETRPGRPAPVRYSWEMYGPAPAPVSVNRPAVWEIYGPVPAPVAVAPAPVPAPVATPSPVITSPSAFGMIMQNRVIDGRLVGQNGKTTDTWL